jgi:hypothetical protein
LRGKERGKHDLVLVKTGKPCNKSHAKENPNACCKVGQTFHEAGSSGFQGVGVAAEKPRVGGRGFARELTRAVAIDQLTFVFRDINVSAGASAGVALLGPDVDGEAALVQADRAMYVRKTARRAKV